MDPTAVPPVPPENGWGTKVVEEALRIARANGLYYTFVGRWTRAGGSLPDAAKTRWSAELHSIETFRSSLDALEDVAGSSGLEYIMIKSAQTLEHVPRDIDIFVREADRAAFLESLKSRGFGFVYNDGGEISLARPGAMRVDVYSRIHYLGRDFLDEAFLFRSRMETPVHDRKVPGLLPEAAFLLNSVHGIFGHGAITLLDLLDLRNLRMLAEGERFRDRAEKFGWARVYDLWSARLASLEAQMYSRHVPVPFPQRLESRFVINAVASLNGHDLGLRGQMLLRLSLLWDRALFVSEAHGFQNALGRSALARAIANSAGHRIRFMRGDRKSTVRALKRVREGS